MFERAAPARQPRALLEVELGSGEGAVRARVMQESLYAIPAGRPPDFGDLTLWEGAVYALVRSAHLVVRLQRQGEAWAEGDAASYAAVEGDERLRYVDMTFGMGEGLALTSDRSFVVLDNNGQSRASAPADVRPLLFVLRRPLGF